MIRSICGHDVPENNRFCGLCGSAVVPERRRGERRGADQRRTLGERRSVAAGPGPIPISRGRTVTAEPQVDSTVMREAVPPVPSVSVRREEFTAPAGASRVSGPSFLGLADAPSNADYLLEDEPRRSFSWRRAALLVFLVVVLVLFGLQYRAMYQAKTVDIAPPNSEETQPEEAKPQSTDEADPKSKDSQDVTPQSDAPQQKDAPVPQSRADSDETPADEAEASAPATKEEKELQDPEPVSAKGNGAADEPEQAEDPAEELTPADNELLTRAQRYLQGRGVPQDCEQGMTLLRAAANRPNAKARIQMATQYAAGLCVPQDRPTAYMWFTRALQLDPSNPWIERNRRNVYAQMSAEERRMIDSMY